MKRWHQEVSHYKRQKAKDSLFASGKTKTQLGRYRKRHALDCGKTRCRTCHNDKFPKRERHDQELLAVLSYVEQVADYLSQKEETNGVPAG